MGKPAAAARTVFVVHAAEDRSALDQLRGQLAAAGPRALIVTSFDDVPPGSEDVRALVDAAELVVILVSAHLFASEFWDHEIDPLLARRDGPSVVRVTLQSVDLGGSPLGRTPVLPRDGRAVGAYALPGEKWAEVTREIKKMLAALPRPAPSTPSRTRPPSSSPSWPGASPSSPGASPSSPSASPSWSGASPSSPGASPSSPGASPSSPSSPGASLSSPGASPPLPPPRRSEPPLPRKLLEALRAGTLIPFAGAGVSMAVMDARRPGQRLFPSWAGLLELAAAQLAADGNEGDAMAVRGAMKRTRPSYLEAARNARDGLRDGWADLLHDALDPPREHAEGPSLDLPRALWSLGSRLVITTNYDKVLHWACPDLPDLRPWDIEAPAELMQMLQRGVRFPTVWHLHGFVGNTVNVILTPDGYSRLYPSDGVEARHKAALASLRMLLTMRTLLFVGVSFDDTSFADQLRWLTETFSGAGGPHYALVHAGELEAMKRRVADLPLTLIPYEAHGAPLVALLQRLAGLTKP